MSYVILGEKQEKVPRVPKGLRSPVKTAEAAT